jgi:putative transposase
VPSAEAIWEAEKATVERLRAGVPIEDIMAGFRVSIASIQDRLIELAEEHGVAGEDVVFLTRLLWQLSDAFSARAAAAYRQQGVALAVAEQRRRDEWLMALLAGTLDPAQLEQGIATYRLGRETGYVPFCTGARDDAALERGLHVLTEHFRNIGTAMLLPNDGQLVGILPEVPPGLPWLLVAVGPPACPEQLAASYSVARHVLAAASLHFSEGVHTVEALGWRIGVPLAPELPALVRVRYLEPLHASGAFGSQVVEALRAYLEHDRNIPQTAAALHVHVNTLRYRLNRFEEVTGQSLMQTDTLVELAWALYLEPPAS